MHIAKEYRTEVRALVELGWTFSSKGKHPKLKCPAGRHSIPVPTGTSGGRQLLAAWHRQLERHGRVECSPAGTRPG